MPTITNEPKPMELQRRWQLDSALSALEGPDDAPYLDQRRLPADLRAYLTRRISDELIPAFQGIDPRTLQNLLSRFLAGYAVTSSKLTSDDYRDYLEEAAAALASYPQWHLERVISRFRRGAAGHAAHAPTVPQLAEEARRLMDPWVHEAVDIRKVLNARPITERYRSPEEQARIDAAFAAFKAGIAQVKKLRDPHEDLIEMLAEVGKTHAEAEAIINAIPELDPRTAPIAYAKAQELKLLLASQRAAHGQRLLGGPSQDEEDRS